MTFSVRVHLLLFLVKHTKDSNQSQASKGKLVMKKGITKKKKRGLSSSINKTTKKTREKKNSGQFIVAHSLRSHCKMLCQVAYLSSRKTFTPVCRTASNGMTSR